MELDKVTGYTQKLNEALDKIDIHSVDMKHFMEITADIILTLDHEEVLREFRAYNAANGINSQKVQKNWSIIVNDQTGLTDEDLYTYFTILDKITPTLKMFSDLTRYIGSFYEGVTVNEVSDPAKKQKYMDTAAVANVAYVLTWEPLLLEKTSV